MYRYVKRVIDFLFALFISPFLIIVALFVGIAIKIDDGGTVFYSAKRLGMHGDLFCMHKFRSMKVNAQDLRNKDGSTYNSSKDPRVTKVGKFLRKSSLDELPQIINVMKGDMSFVGPRPDLPEALFRYTSSQKKKLNVRPGITGYSQAYYRNSINRNRKLENDIFYVENQSFALDCRIICVTIKNVTCKRNVFSNDE